MRTNMTNIEAETCLVIIEEQINQFEKQHSDRAIDHRGSHITDDSQAMPEVSANVIQGMAWGVGGGATGTPDEENGEKARQ